MILAVASGKGGTGKTTVSVNLAWVLGAPIQALDCDVEEPNAHLFLQNDILPGSSNTKEIVTLPVPEVDESLCDGCGECGRFCEYNAIVSFGSKPLVFPDMSRLRGMRPGLPAEGHSRKRPPHRPGGDRASETSH